MERKTFETSLVEQLENYDARTGINSAILDRNAWWMQGALWTALVSLVVGGAATAAFLAAGRY